MTRDYETPRFPPPETADREGLVSVGGRLTPPWLLTAYRQGIFPWPLLLPDGYALAWFSPDPRVLLPWETLHIPRRLARRLRRCEFTITCDQAFGDVIQGCAAPRRTDSVTWITPAVKRAYKTFHELGYAHSIEVWQEDRLVGGLYGVAIGEYFSGESMFHRVRDASKAAVVALAAHLHRRGFTLFDIQQATPHMVALGAVAMPRRQFLRKVREATRQPPRFGTPAEFSQSVAWLVDHLASRSASPS